MAQTKNFRSLQTHQALQSFPSTSTIKNPANLYQSKSQSTIKALSAQPKHRSGFGFRFPAGRTPVHLYKPVASQTLDSLHTRHTPRLLRMAWMYGLRPALYTQPKVDSTSPTFLLTES